MQKVVGRLILIVRIDNVGDCCYDFHAFLPAIQEAGINRFGFGLGQEVIQQIFRDGEAFRDDGAEIVLDGSVVLEAVGEDSA
jgi:hypothetical protein